jgi:hypothetical protein
MSRRLAMKAAEEDAQHVESGADAELGLRQWLRGLITR